jgi:hypothetical protein
VLLIRDLIRRPLTCFCMILDSSLTFLLMSTPRNLTSFCVILVTLVFSSLSSMLSLSLRKFLHSSFNCSASVLSPITPISQSSAYLTYLTLAPTLTLDCKVFLSALSALIRFSVSSHLLFGYLSFSRDSSVEYFIIFGFTLDISLSFDEYFSINVITKLSNSLR